MYQFRCSKLKDVISDPLAYYYEKSSDVKTQAMLDGSAREVLSYDLFTAFKCDLDKNNYKQQVEGELLATDWKCTAHADIVGNDYIVDIKNSNQKDKELIDAYQYQVSMYCAIFHKSKGYLFVDTNKGNEMDLAKCRLIEIPLIDEQTLITYLNNVVKALEVYPYKSEPTKMDCPLIDEYASNEEMIKNLEKRNEEIKAILETMTTQDSWIETPTNELRIYLRRQFTRTVKVLENKWTGNYTTYIKVVKNKGNKK